MTSDPASASVAAKRADQRAGLQPRQQRRGEVRRGEFADAAGDGEGVSAEGEQQSAVRAAFAKPDQGIRRGACVADLAAQHRLERVPLGDFAEEAMVGHREACRKTGAQSLARELDRRLGENRIWIRR